MAELRKTRKDFASDAEYQQYLKDNPEQTAPVAPVVNARAAGLTIMALTIAFENGAMVATGQDDKGNPVAINMPSAFNNGWSAMLAPKLKGGAKLQISAYVNKPDATVGRQNYQFLRPTDEAAINVGIDPATLATAEEATSDFNSARLKSAKVRQERRALWS